LYNTANNSNNASLSVPLHHVPQINNANLHSLMRPSHFYPQHPHPHPPHHQYQQHQQQPAHQMARPSPSSNGHMNTATQRIASEGVGTRPGSAGALSGLIDLSCSGPRFQHHYQIQPATSDVTGKVYPTPEREVGCSQNLHGSRAGSHREGVSDLRLMIPPSPIDAVQQVSRHVCRPYC